MTSRPGFDAKTLELAEKILAVLAEGNFTATYKPAVLLALIDVCMEHSTRTGSAPPAVTTTQLARKVVDLYWPQATPYLETGRVLRQYQGRDGMRTSQAEIVRKVRTFRERHAPDPSATLHDARRAAPSELERLERNVEWALIENPLPRLQRRGRETDRFLYEIGWDESIHRADMRAPTFNNHILFVDEGRAGERLLALAPLVRPLAQHRWVSLVAQWNRELPRLGAAVELERFLFGEERVALARVTAPLIELQRGVCFYCQGRIRGVPNIDHFLPWARYADNGLDNLVAAHDDCNRGKSDHLAAVSHVERWLARGHEHGAELETIARSVSWERAPARTLGVARSMYLRLPESVPLWVAGRDTFEAAHHGTLRGLFAQLPE